MDIAYILVPLIIAAAFYCESIFGFGGGLISIPLLSVILGVKDSVTLVLVFQLCMGVLIWQSRRDITWPVARPLTISLVVGTIAGTLALSLINTTLLQIVLAGAIVMFLVKSL